MKKKILMISFVLSTSLALSACGSNDNTETVAQTETVETITETSQETTEELLTEEVESTESIDTTESTEPIETLEPAESTELTETLEPAESTEPTETTEPIETSENTGAEVEETDDSPTWDENKTASNAAELEEMYQAAMKSWTKKATWTASNGVTIKINDAYADVIPASGNISGGGSGNAIYYDGTECLEPNSDFMTAVNEFIYGDEAYLNGTDRFNPEVVDVSLLPDIPCASSKQTSIPDSADFTAYKTAFNEMYGFQVSGKWGANPAYCLQNYGSGIGLLSAASSYLWTMEYSSNGWMVRLNVNPSELQHDALLNSIRLVSPDGDAVYNAIYEQFYYGADWIEAYDIWYTVPGTNTEIMLTNCTGSGHSDFYFR